jgi:predicted enzyme related to lactoylglutathione lyase
VPAADEQHPIAWAGVTIDCREPQRTATFWSALLNLPARAAGSDREGWFRLGPVVSGGPVINFQPVAETNVGKVRIHLDLWVDDLDAVARQVSALGGSPSRQREVVAGRGTVWVMTDPEGHEFCIISADGS